MSETKTAGDDACIGRARPREAVKRRVSLLMLLLTLWLVVPAAVPRATSLSLQQDDTLSSMGYVFSMAFSSDGKKALTGHLDGAMMMWDVETGTQLRVFPSDDGSDSAVFVAFMPGGGAVLSATWSTVTLWNLTDGKQILRFKIGRGDQRFALAPDGKTLLSGNGIGIIAVWDTRTGKLLRTYRPFRPFDVGVAGLAFTPNGRDILTSSELSPMIELMNLRTGRVRWRVEAAADYSNHARVVAVSPDGTKGLSGGYDGGIKLWNLSTGKLLRSFQYPQGQIHRVLFSPDGKLIVTAGDPDHKQETSPVLVLWDVATGKQLRRFVGHTRQVHAAAFSPDGKWLLSGGMNARLRLWDVATGEEIRSFPAGPIDPAQAVAVSAGTRP